MARMKQLVDLLHLQTQSAVSPDLKGTNRKKREEEI
jgi:hypothetical protein